MQKSNGVVKEGAMHKNVAVKTDEKKRWRTEVLNKVTRPIRLDFQTWPLSMLYMRIVTLSLISKSLLITNFK